MKSVAILGTGPAGLMAAHACRMKGLPITLIGLGTQSNLAGAQFLHKPIPLLNDEKPDGVIYYSMSGNPGQYKEKVYGTADVPFVSAESVTNGLAVNGWNLRTTYSDLWSDIAGSGDSINPLAVDAHWIQEQLESDRFHLIISTIPKPATCLAHAGLIDRTHQFVSQPIRVMEDSVLGNAFDNTIVYDGTKDASWYRTARIFGYGSTEWGESAKDSPLTVYKGLYTVKKPLHHNCNCWLGKIVFTGRYGAWQKGLLTHDSFIQTWEVLSNAN